MKFRKLRIAWSVACGIACVLLIVLWALSYWRAYHLGAVDGAVGATVDYGQVSIFLAPPLAAEIGWSLYSTPPLFDEWEGYPVRKPSPLRFRFKINPDADTYIYAAAPGWSLCLFAAALAVLPWVSRAWRFSLRTLLVVTTLVAVVLGAIAYAMR